MIYYKEIKWRIKKTNWEKGERVGKKFFFGVGKSIKNPLF